MSQSSNPYLALDNLREMNRIATTTMGGNEKMQEMAMASPLEYGMVTATQAQCLVWKRQEMFKLPGRNRRSEGYAMQLCSKRKQVRSRKSIGRTRHICKRHQDGITKASKRKATNDSSMIKGKPAIPEGVRTV